MTGSITTTQEQLKRKAQWVLRARRAADKAHKVVERAEAAFMELTHAFGVNRVELDEATVQVVNSSRRTISADIVTKLLPPDIVALVTKPVVDLEKFDQAVALGLVPPDVVVAATLTKEYTNVRVSVH